MSEAREPTENEQQDQVGPDQDQSAERAKAARSADLLGPKTSKLRKRLVKEWDKIRKGWEDQADRSDEISDAWDAYNCVLNANQKYDSDAQIYVPIVHDAVNARATRYVNQLFPAGGGYIDAVGPGGDTAPEMVSLLDHYAVQAELKTSVGIPLCINGDIEGQYNLYVDWNVVEREVIQRFMRGPPLPIGNGEAPLDMPGNIPDVRTVEIKDQRPSCEVLHDSDVLVLPASADTIDEALAVGGSVTICRRWSKTKLESMIEAGHVRKDEGEAIMREMDIAANADTKNIYPHNLEKELIEITGIRKTGKEVTVWETWMMLPLADSGKYSEDGTPRLCRLYLGHNREALGCVRNPFWNDRCPLLSRPNQKVAGSFKGRAPVSGGILTLQYEANDAVNEGADASHYSAAPILMRDPVTGNAPLIMNIGALWNIDPAKVKVLEFPDLTDRAIKRVQYCIAQIFQSLSVNPSMLPQQTSTSKRNQAQVAQEQQIDLLTTAHQVSIQEQGIYTPLLAWWLDLDYQYRDREISIQRLGGLGERASMTKVDPINDRDQYMVRWFATEAARNAQQQQLQIAWFNAARGMADQLLEQGYILNPVPALIASGQSIFSPKIGALTIEKNPEQAARQIQLKLEMAQMGGPPGGPGGPPGATRPPRGGAPPRQGAMPARPNIMQQSPGAIAPERMVAAGAPVMPRRM